MGDELADRDRLGPRHDEDPPRRLRHGCRADDALYEVVDVHRAVHAAPAGGQRQLPRLQPLHRLDRPRPRARPVDVTGAHDRARHLAVRVGRKHDLLARDLRVHVVNAVRAHRRTLVYLALEVEPERHDRRQVHEALHPAGHRGIEHHPRRPDIAFPVALGRAVHPDERGGVNHDVAARDMTLPFAGRRHVALHDRFVVAGPQVDAAHLAAQRPVPLDQHAADEPVRARDKDLLGRVRLGHRPQPIRRPRAGSQAATRSPPGSSRWSRPIDRASRICAWTGSARRPRRTAAGYV